MGRLALAASPQRPHAGAAREGDRPQRGRAPRLRRDRGPLPPRHLAVLPEPHRPRAPILSHPHAGHPGARGGRGASRRAARSARGGQAPAGPRHRAQIPGPGPSARSRSLLGLLPSLHAAAHHLRRRGRHLARGAAGGRGLSARASRSARRARLGRRPAVALHGAADRAAGADPQRSARRDRPQPSCGRCRPGTTSSLRSTSSPISITPRRSPARPGKPASGSSIAASRWRTRRCSCAG